MTDDINSKENDLHLGLIPDGNRRWAAQRGMNPWEGHKAGAERIKDFIQWCLACKIIRIKEISVYLMSTDNIDRPAEEVRELWELYTKEFNGIQTNRLIKKNHVRVNVVGNKKLWHPTFREAAKNAMEATKMYADYLLNLTVAYSGKFEINQAVEKMIKKSATSIEKFLQVKTPLDLIIRPGDQHRMSNFFMWQTPYTELRFTKTLWPNYTKEKFEADIIWYLKRQKRFGR